MYIYSYNPGSEGALNLKEALGIQRIKNENSKFKGDAKRVVINWGSSTLPREVEKCRVINRAVDVHTASNKLSFFRKISAINRDIIPPWTTDFNQAVAWVGEGREVCARTILNGHSANGLFIMSKDKPASLIRAPLYTQYVPKQDEYRIHVVGGQIVDQQRKALKRDFVQELEAKGEKPNTKIRNLENGYIYMREGVVPPEQVRTVALEAMRIAELDFGAVDVIWNATQRRAYVLEVNTAPGLTGTTVQNYAEAFKRFENG